MTDGVYGGWDTPRFIDTGENPNCRSAYCRDLIYADGYERSFEEMRATVWLRNRAIQCAGYQRENERLQSELVRLREQAESRDNQLATAVEHKSQLIADLQLQVAQLSKQLKTAQSGAIGAQQLSQQMVNSSNSDSRLHSSSSEMLCDSIATVGGVISSPTFNTREALNFVRATMESTQQTCDFETRGQSSLPNRPTSTAPFTVYVDTSVIGAQKSHPLPNAPPTTVYSEDKENLPPPRLNQSKEPESKVSSMQPPKPPMVPPEHNKPTKSLQFDDELTGFHALPDISMVQPLNPAMFAAGAGRVSSTPMVSVDHRRLKEEAEEEEDGEFTANVNMYRACAKVEGRGVATPAPALNTIMEGSREDHYRTSSSSGGVSDPSAQAESQFSVPAVVAADSSAAAGALSATSALMRPPAMAGLSLPSGYLADGSSQRACEPMDCLSPCRPQLQQSHSQLPSTSVHLGVASGCGGEDGADAAMSSDLADLNLSYQPPGELTMPLPTCATDPHQPGGFTAAAAIDPWSEQLLSRLLLAVEPPLNRRGVFVALGDHTMPDFSQRRVQLDGVLWRVTPIGMGAYARVYQAVCDGGDEGEVITCFKVQQADARWEVYVVDELWRRLGNSCEGAIMRVSAAFLYADGTVICTDLVSGGTLLDLKNREGPGACSLDAVVLLLTAEMLANVQLVHEAGIVHGDVKPDNFLIRLDALEKACDQLRIGCTDSDDFPSSRLLQLIDFGRAIDMRVLPSGTTFRRCVKTQCFACPEMLSEREWTFQTDLFGVAASAYLLLFGEYMKLRPPARGSRWTLPPGHDFKRYWKTGIWRRFFDEFLNIESCDRLPDLSYWRTTLLKEALSDNRLKGLMSQVLVRLKQR